MSIILMGLNHKSAPIEVREHVSLSKPQIIKYSHVLASVSEFSGCAILSTCNRTEFYCNAESIKTAISAIERLVSQRSKMSIEDLRPYLYTATDRDAVNHLFYVAAGLDSMVLGESQIQGQVQDAYEIALHEGFSDSIINTLFMNALTVGKRVRTETQIDRQAVSISSAAVALAQSFFADVVDKTVLVLGAGETSELTSRHLVSRGISSIMVANRTFDRAQWLASEIGGQAIHLDVLPIYIRQADIIISSTASPKYFIEPSDIEPYISDRKEPMLIIDIAMPRDIDPEVGKLKNVTLFDIDDLEKVVSHNKSMREKEAKEAIKIIEEELDDFYFWLDSLWVVPTIVKMREQAEQIKNTEVQRAKNRIDNITSREEMIIETLAKSIVNRWLHKPIVNMKSLAGKRIDRIDCYIQAINDVWDLSREVDDNHD